MLDSCQDYRLTEVGSFKREGNSLKCLLEREPNEFAKRRRHSGAENQRIPGLSPRLLIDHELPHTLLSVANCRTG